jgi:predicted RNA binding protein YcfA (HicA-like mRNA interferase family)
VPTAKVREVLQMLVADGWVLVRPGPHRPFHHPVKPGTVTVSGASGDDIDRGTLRSVFRQAGLEWPPALRRRREGLR